MSDIREFLVTNLGEVEDTQFQLSERKGRVLKLPATSHRFVKKSLQKAKRGQQQYSLNQMVPKA
ncbi:MAG: hypothetical protein Q8K51_07375, partial [Nitrospirota bacterium]|nr:hypothetical protein [Nitrospirota bacterium]